MNLKKLWSLQPLVNLNAILLMAFGIAFTVYGPLMLAFFQVADIPSQDALLYWYTASFARLFGAALCGGGLLLFSLHELTGDKTDSPIARRGICSAMVLFNGIGAFVAITQTVSIWHGLAGWVMFSIFGLFFLAYSRLWITSMKEV